MSAKKRRDDCLPEVDPRSNLPIAAPRDEEGLQSVHQPFTARSYHQDAKHEDFTSVAQIVSKEPANIHGKPLWRKAYRTFGIMLALSVIVAVGLGVGLGVGLSKRSHTR